MKYVRIKLNSFLISRAQSQIFFSRSAKKNVFSVEQIVHWDSGDISMLAKRIV